MGLLSLLNLKSNPEKRKQKFVKDNLGAILNSDVFIKYTRDENGNEKSQEEIQLVKDTLEEAISTSYTENAADYFGSQSYVGSLFDQALKYAGFGFNVAGTILFHGAFGYGLVSKTIGLGLNSIKDIFKGYRFLVHANYSFSDVLKITGEALAERAAAFTPYGAGEIADVVRSDDKFDQHVKNYAINKAKDIFRIKMREKQGQGDNGINIIKLSEFQHPEYRDELEPAHRLAA